MKLRISVRDAFIVLATLFLTSALLVTYVAPQADASHEPANKVAVAGSTAEVLGVNDAAEVILSEQLRVASPTDLGLLVQLECSLVTDVKTVGDDDQFAEAKFDVWVTIDGVEVPVAQDGEGEVTFCNRRYQRAVSGLNNGTLDDDSDDDLTIETFLDTKSTHGFNWIALNSGNEYDADGDNVLTVEVWARYTEAESNADQNAEAVIGNRTLIIEPNNYSVHEAVVQGPGAGN